MTDFCDITSRLFGIYDKVMYLKMFVEADDNDLKNLYIAAANNHNAKLMKSSEMIDAGFVNVYNMLGGYNAWTAAGYPITE